MKNSFVVTAVSRSSGINSDGIIVSAADSLSMAQISAEFVASYETLAYITEVGINGVVNRWKVDKEKDLELEKMEVYA